MRAPEGRHMCRPYGRCMHRPWPRRMRRGPSNQAIQEVLRTMLLEGRHAIITGSSSGIGRSCAIRLAQEGADVCINYYSDKEVEAADEVLEQVKPTGRK